MSMYVFAVKYHLPDTRWLIPLVGLKVNTVVQVLWDPETEFHSFDHVILTVPRYIRHLCHPTRSENTHKSLVRKHYKG